MAECNLIEKCIFFHDQMKNMPKTSGVLKERYCKDKHEECARFMVAQAKGREAVPKDLFPHQVETARAILRRK